MSRRSDQKYVYFLLVSYNIDVDFATFGILVHFLLGLHGLHPSAGEIKTWRTTFHSYTMLHRAHYSDVT